MVPFFFFFFFKQPRLREKVGFQAREVRPWVGREWKGKNRLESFSECNMDRLWLSTLAISFLLKKGIEL